jgi:predicted RNA-binding Zn-ribbon protein involved in translation (DUF1610 family)
MVEAFVRLLCPECGKDWETSPGELSTPSSNFSCPSCHATRRLSEFVRTKRDLETLKQFQ